MFKPPLANPLQRRTVRPLYAQHQATPYGGFLDPNWVKSTFDIYPGMVMCRVGPGEIFSPVTAVGQKPYGLAALFVAPVLGIDEVAPTNTNLYTVWVGGDQATFEILAPAFDSTATWTAPSGGSRVMLYPSLTAGQIGKLTNVLPAGMDSTYAIAELIDVPNAQTIVIRLNRLP